jgi:hypothetical protein
MNLHLTEDEIIEYLKRSSLTTVLVEGKDDMIIYRWIEEEIGIQNANFMSCGGRDRLLKVFNRRNEFNHIKTVFVADKDAFVYDKTPDNLSDIIWTKGYSIENDLYQGQKIEQLLDVNENVKFRKAISNYITYYAFEVEQYQKKLIYNFSNHPNQILCNAQNLKQDFLDEINFESPNNETIEYLQKEYDSLLRGKSLFALLIRFLSARNRNIKHSKNSLLEHCFKMHRSDSMNNIIEQLKEKLYA